MSLWPSWSQLPFWLFSVWIVVYWPKKKRQRPISRGESLQQFYPKWSTILKFQLSIGDPSSLNPCHFLPVWKLLTQGNLKERIEWRVLDSSKICLQEEVAVSSSWWMALLVWSVLVWRACLLFNEVPHFCFLFVSIQSLAKWESENKMVCEQRLLKGDGPKTSWSRELTNDGELILVR